MRILLYIFFFLISICPWAQNDSQSPKFSFNSDFRFRIEHDWNSKKSDGTYREDRSRLRYRFRVGVDYQYKEWASVGASIRTGNPKKQQDPQLTLGDGFKEFGTLPIALEKLFFKIDTKGYIVWIGKNTFPFKKQNELFWSDNVYPEGVFLKKGLILKSNTVNEIAISGGHFIINSRGSLFFDDSYLQGIQLTSNWFNDKLTLFPSLYLFRNIQNIPDGGETFLFDYSIAHVGTQFTLSKKPLINLEADYYINVENYDNNDSIPLNLKDQKSGFIAAVGYGKLKKKGDLQLKLTYTHLQQYTAVDFLAQNDWARWDYSAFDSPDGRLTNFKGFELVAGYIIARKMSLKMKYYLVEQLVPYGSTKETGSRVRFDLDIKF